MRLRLALITLVFPASLGALAYGCNAQAPSIQDFCGFLDDSQNCYQRYFDDIGARCATAGAGTARKGTFVDRAKLDKCVLDDGGAITFERAIDTANFPPSAVSFTVSDAIGDTCGSFTFGGVYDQTINVQSAATDDGGVSKDAGDSCPDVPEIKLKDGGVLGNGANEGFICGGTLKMVNTDGDFIDLSCPNGEMHHFISLQLDKVEDAGNKQTGCVDKETGVPLKNQIARYEITGSPGGIEKTGNIKVTAVYPGDKVVEYFDCTIPALPKQCCNGVKDGSETDVDCGGPTDPAAAACDRCQAMQGCISDADCANDQPCTVSAMTGIKTCGMLAQLSSSICNGVPTSSSSSSSSSGAGGASGSGGAGGN